MKALTSTKLTYNPKLNNSLINPFILENGKYFHNFEIYPYYVDLNSKIEIKDEN